MSCRSNGAPDVSVVVVVHNMAREAPRTLLSLSAGYQRNIAADDYEVIVVDNGSTPPLDANLLPGLAGNFSLIRIESAPASPALAINRGLAAARGDIVGVMIDGARIVTPGLLHFARHAARLYPRAVVASLGWYLGFDQQRWAAEAGYDAIREDAMLASIDWPSDGYRLFEIASQDPSSVDGWFSTIIESNSLFLRREAWNELKGADERFDIAGGGFLNLDTFIRALELAGSELVILLGEGTFHQIHGGISTNSKWGTFSPAIQSWRAQYCDIRGKPWSSPRVEKRTYLGTLPRAALLHFARAVIEPARSQPLGASFDQGLWSLGPAPPASDPATAALVSLAEGEFRARRFAASATVARMARARSPDDVAPLRVLAHAGAWLPGDKPADSHRADFHVARGNAHRLLGEATAAESEFRQALAFDADLPQAHIGLSLLRMPGEYCYTWLERFHSALRPESYVEIGISRGRSLCLARPPTCAIGVDPAPNIAEALTTETHIFTETSDEFFSRRRIDSLLNGQPLRMGFIDGLHLFEQALRDFIHLESYCGPRSLLLFHDTLPLDEPTQTRDRRTKFHTGDVWKTILCLKRYRPDLDIFTIPTAWTGLTVVAGTDSKSRVLAEKYDEAVARFIDMPFSEIDGDAERALSVVSNNWQTVEDRLKARLVL